MLEWLRSMGHYPEKRLGAALEPEELTSLLLSTAVADLLGLVMFTRPLRASAPTTPLV